MKRGITINITLDDETASITDFHITEGLYNHTEFVAEDIDDPISIYTCTKCISRELTNMLANLTPYMVK